jgi:hypothetical protein
MLHRVNWPFAGAKSIKNWWDRSVEAKLPPPGALANDGLSRFFFA